MRGAVASVGVGFPFLPHSRRNTAESFVCLRGSFTARISFDVPSMFHSSIRTSFINWT